MPPGMPAIGDEGRGVEPLGGLRKAATVRAQIGTGAGDQRDDAQTIAAILQRIIVGLNTKLLRCIRIRHEIAIVPHHGHVDTAVQVEAHRIDATVEATTDNDLGRGQTHDRVVTRPIAPGGRGV